MMVLDGYCLWKKSGSPVDIGNIPAIVVVKPTATGSCSSTTLMGATNPGKPWQIMQSDRLGPVTLKCTKGKCD